MIEKQVWTEPNNKKTKKSKTHLRFGVCVSENCKTCLRFFFFKRHANECTHVYLIWFNSKPRRTTNSPVWCTATICIKYLTVIRRLKQRLFGCQSTSEEDQVRCSWHINKHSCERSTVSQEAIFHLWFSEDTTTTEENLIS